MSNNPSQLLLKRRRAEESGPEYLVLESKAQHADADAVGQLVRYMKKRRHQHEHKEENGGEEARFADPAVSERRKARAAGRRVFHLQDLSAGVRVPATGKRKAGDGEEGRVATFVEQKRHKTIALDQDDGEGYVRETNGASPTHRGGDGAVNVTGERFKRPGKGSALRQNARTGGGTAQREETADQRKTKAELVDYLARAAEEEIAAEQQTSTRESRSSPPYVAAAGRPKLSPSRAREMHEKRIASNNSLASSAAVKDLGMDNSPSSDDENDYEFDTYILAPNPSFPTMPSAPDADAEIGYLIIPPSSQDLWQTYLEDSPDEKDSTLSDDEDSNAEDYYGADYPEDEVDSDDEFGREAYGYRRGGDEEWGFDDDVDEYAESGDEDEAGYERMMEPFRRLGVSAHGREGEVRVGSGW